MTYEDKALYDSTPPCRNDANRTRLQGALATATALVDAAQLKAAPPKKLCVCTYQYTRTHNHTHTNTHTQTPVAFKTRALIGQKLLKNNHYKIWVQSNLYTHTHGTLKIRALVGQKFLKSLRSLLASIGHNHFAHLYNANMYNTFVRFTKSVSLKLGVICLSRMYVYTCSHVSGPNHLVKHRLAHAKSDVWRSWRLMWDVNDMGCDSYGLWIIWDVTHMGCDSYGLWIIWDVTHMGCESYGMWLIWVVNHMGCDSYGLWIIWDVTHMGCESFDEHEDRCVHLYMHMHMGCDSYGMWLIRQT